VVIMSFREDQYLDAEALLRQDYSPERELAVEIRKIDNVVNLQTESRPTPKSASWYGKAACNGASTDLFFGPDGERPAAKKRRETEANIVCQSCVVISECAKASQKQWGFWAGTNEEDRYFKGNDFAPRAYSATESVRVKRNVQNRSAS
jgi:WhiB family transcriptional regulator, redox-sensing transcriptional regulator